LSRRYVHHEPLLPTIFNSARDIADLVHHIGTPIQPFNRAGLRICLIGSSSFVRPFPIRRYKAFLKHQQKLKALPVFNVALQENTCILVLSRVSDLARLGLCRLRTLIAACYAAPDPEAEFNHPGLSVDLVETLPGDLRFISI
jgi:hypothetical protein